MIQWHATRGSLDQWLNFQFNDLSTRSYRFLDPVNIKINYYWRYREDRWRVAINEDRIKDLGKHCLKRRNFKGIFLLNLPMSDTWQNKSQIFVKHKGRRNGEPALSSLVSTSSLFFASFYLTLPFLSIPSSKPKFTHLVKLFFFFFLSKLSPLNLP